MLRDERARGNHNAHVDGLALLDLDIDEASVRQEHLVAAECDEPEASIKSLLGMRPLTSHVIENRSCATFL